MRITGYDMNNMMCMNDVDIIYNDIFIIIWPNVLCFHVTGHNEFFIL